VNINTTKLAFSIATRLSQSEDKQLSSLEKDILLEDLRNLYKEILNSDASASVVKEVPVEKKAEPIQPKQEVVQVFSIGEVTPPSSVEVQKVEAEKFSTEPIVSIEKEETKPIAEISLAEETNPTFVEEEKEIESLQQLNHDVLISEEKEPEHKNTFTASVGIGGEPESFSGSINEVFKREENSINSQATNAVRELHSVVASSSFSGMLDLNKRILFTKELFNDNSESFNLFVQQLEKSKGLDDAKSLVNTTALSKQWKLENDAVRLLVSLVRQHFEFR
jgi:hypothetical protein